MKISNSHFDRGRRIGHWFIRLWLPTNSLQWLSWWKPWFVDAKSISHFVALEWNGHRCGTPYVTQCDMYIRFIGTTWTCNSRIIFSLSQVRIKDLARTYFMACDQNQTIRFHRTKYWLTKRVPSKRWQALQSWESRECRHTIKMHFAMECVWSRDRLIATVSEFFSSPCAYRIFIHIIFRACVGSIDRLSYTGCTHRK